MTAYTFAVSCPLCARPVDHQTSGERPGVEQHAVARCEPCGRIWGLSLYMRDITREVHSPRPDADEVLEREQARRRTRRVEVAA